jgi:hypothetical protein
MLLTVVMGMIGMVVLIETAMVVMHLDLLNRADRKSSRLSEMRILDQRPVAVEQHDARRLRIAAWEVVNSHASVD